jgi:hypothetical protein
MVRLSMLLMLVTMNTPTNWHLLLCQESSQRCGCDGIVVHHSSLACVQTQQEMLEHAQVLHCRLPCNPYACLLTHRPMHVLHVCELFIHRYTTSMCFIDVCYSFTGTLQVCVLLMCVIHSQVHYKYVFH